MRAKIRLKEQFVEKTETKPEKVKVSKKALRKQNLMTKMQNDRDVENIKKFVDNRFEIFTIFKDGKYHITKKYDKAGWKKEDDKVKDYAVSCGFKMLYKLPWKLIHDMKKIKYMTINFQIKTFTDCGGDNEDEPDIVLSREYGIASINKLMNYVVRREGMMELLRVYTSDIGWYTAIDMEETLTILYRNGHVKKMDLIKFLAEYKISGI